MSKPGHGHKKRRRKVFAMTKRREDVARMYLEGKTQREIAAALGVDQKTVCSDIKAIIELWKQESVALVDQRFAVKLRELDKIIRDAKDSYERSRENRVVERVEQEGTPPDKDGKTSILKVRKYRESVGQAGDPRFLQTILEARREESKLLGHYKPTKVAPTDPEGKGPAEQPRVMVFHVGSSDPDAAPGD
jgi:DNA-binding CsgD family transcriptional regulator